MFKLVGSIADNLNVEAYAVGGYVRDLLLDRRSKDIDFVCVGSGIELATKVARALSSDLHVATYKTYGTAAFTWEGNEYEFVGARKESYRRESRNPIVEEGTLEDDQLRRDFSINAMAICLNNDRFGELVDPFDGVSDLEKKRVVTPTDPQVTFSDDPLRMLRAIRFAAQLGFDIDDVTFEAIRNNAHRIEIISRERVATELNKMILAMTPSYGFKLLAESGLMQQVFPDFLKLQGKEIKNGMSHKDNFYHTLEVLDNISVHTDDLWLRWAAILHDIAKPRTKRFHPKAGWTFHGHEDLGAKMVPGIFKSLKLPLDGRMRYVQKLVRLHLRPIALAKEEITDSAIRRVLFEAGDDVDDLMTLCRADITSKNEYKVKKYMDNFRRVEVKLKEVEESDKIRNFQPCFSGKDIMDLFGIQPCREVGILKDALKDAVLDGEIQNELDQAKKYVIKEGKKYNLEPK